MSLWHKASMLGMIFCVTAIYFAQYFLRYHCDLLPVTESKILADTKKFSNRPKSEKWINLINGITKTCLNGVGPQSLSQWTEDCYLFSKKLFLLGNKFKIVSQLVQRRIGKHGWNCFVYDNHTYEWEAEIALPWGHFIYHSKEVGAKRVSGKDCQLVVNTWSFLESVENNVWITNKHFPVNITFDEFQTKRPHRHGDECDTENYFEYVQIAQRWKVCGIHSEWSYFSKKNTLGIKIVAKAQSYQLQSVLRVSFSFQAIEGIQTCIPIQRFPNMYFANLQDISGQNYNYIQQSKVQRRKYLLSLFKLKSTILLKSWS